MDGIVIHDTLGMETAVINRVDDEDDEVHIILVDEKCQLML